MKTAEAYLREGADLYEERSAIYGNNWLLIGKMLEALFPEGVTLKTADDWNRMHLFIQMMTKVTRYSACWKEGGHVDSSLDLTVYTSMLHALDQIIKEMKK